MKYDYLAEYTFYRDMLVLVTQTITYFYLDGEPFGINEFTPKGLVTVIYLSKENIWCKFKLYFECSLCKPRWTRFLT
jgi:hypothetical protein